MPSAHDFLVALALVLGVAAVTTIVFHRLRQPVVLGYLVAGLLVGPHFAAFPLTADTALIQALSELGVILLMFSLGLEFRLGALMRVGPTALLTGLFQTSAMVWVGFMAGRAFGWSVLESVFAGAVIAISSTTIIARAFEELKVKEPVKGIVVGVLLVEDLVAIVLMAALTAVATGAGLEAGAVALTLGRLGAFLAVLVVGGLLLVPRLMRLVVRTERDEMVVVTGVALSFGLALLASAAGYSVALGAFIAGSLVAESGEGHRVEVAVRPVRDLFAAVFFVSVGMLLDPALLKDTWPLVLVLTALVVVGKVVFVSLGVFFTGNGVRTAVQSGLSLAQIGEFSFIIAGLGLTLHATGTTLYPVAVAVSALTTLITPFLIRGSPRVAAAIDRRLPRRVQNFVALYGSWLERLKTPNPGVVSPARKLVRLLLLDVGTLVGTLIALSLLAPRAEGLARPALFAVGAAVLGVVGFGFARVLRALGNELALRALPQTGRVDFALAPRRVLAALFRVVAVALVLAPISLLLAPFLPPLWVGAVLGVVLLALLVSFWRQATEFEGHLRAGAQVMAEALSHKDTPNPDPLRSVREQLPGLGEPVSAEVAPGSQAEGRTLAQLNLRGLTGATVLAIHRATGDVVLPTAQEPLSAGDVLALAGTTEAVEAARALLGASGEPRVSEGSPAPATTSEPEVVVISRPSDWELIVVNRADGEVLARGRQALEGPVSWEKD